MSLWKRVFQWVSTRLNSEVPMGVNDAWLTGMRTNLGIRSLRWNIWLNMNTQIPFPKNNNHHLVSGPVFLLLVIAKKWDVLRPHTGLERMPLTFLGFGLISDPLSYEERKKVKNWNVKISGQQLEQRGFLKYRLKPEDRVNVQPSGIKLNHSSAISLPTSVIDTIFLFMFFTGLLGCWS